MLYKAGRNLVLDRTTSLISHAHKRQEQAARLGITRSVKLQQSENRPYTNYIIDNQAGNILKGTAAAINIHNIKYLHHHGRAQRMVEEKVPRS